ncbi:MAG: hypothetical protein AB7K67_00205 [Hyphomicrobiaceae bacterium]
MAVVTPERIIVRLAAVASAALLIISIAITFEVGKSFGRTDVEAQLYGAACAFADALKALLFTLSASAFRKRRRTMAITGFALFLLLTTFSFSSTVSFGLAARTFAGDVQILQAEQNKSAISALRDDQGELARIRNRLREPDLSIRERRELERRNHDLATAVADRQRQLALAPRIITATTQSDALARMLGVAPETATVGLAMLLALAMDLGPGIGLAIATAMLGADKPSRRPAKVRALRSDQKQQPKVRPNAERSKVERSVSNFLHERTVKSGTTAATELFSAHLTYCASQGLPSITQRAFGDAMRQLGYEKDRRTASGRVRYLGLTLVEEARTAA